MNCLPKPDSSEGLAESRDQVRHQGNHVKKTLEDQEAILHQYVLYVYPSISLQFTEPLVFLILSGLVVPHRDGRVAAARHLALPDEVLARQHRLRASITAPLIQQQ
jgi:hypothetical protein